MTLREALDALHRAGRIRAASMDGMVYNTELFGRPCRVREHSGVPLSGPGQPDTSDPATVGCLAALAREASGEPGLFAQHRHTTASVEPWLISGWDSRLDRDPATGPSEGAAWADALIALAEALP